MRQPPPSTRPPLRPKRGSGQTRPPTATPLLETEPAVGLLDSTPRASAVSPAQQQDEPPHFPRDAMPAIRRVMVPQDLNATGTIFGGVILSEIDLAAAIVAHHVHPGTLVTVAMDKVEFKHPVFVGDLVSLFGTIQRVGSSSVTVHIQVWAERRMLDAEACLVTEAVVTMVAVDENLKPTPVSHRERWSGAAD